MSQKNKDVLVKIEVKQTMFPEIMRIEIDQINKEIDSKVFEITDAIHRLIMMDNNIESKKSCLQTLELLLGGIHGLQHLQESSNSQGVITMTRSESNVVLEKISVKAKSKKNIRDVDGNLIEKVTSDMKIMDSSFKRIDWDKSKSESISENKITRKDIDG